MQNKIEKKEGTEFYQKTFSSHNEIDIESLKSQYPDIKGYIKIEGTNINYPIVQSNDNNYYLKRLPNGEKNKMGSIFLDYRNNNFNDDNTIIYGHNLNDSTMFSELKNFQNQEYYENHQTFTIYTSEKTIEVKIISGYIADASKEELKINFKENELQNYLNTISKKSFIKSDENYENIKQIITLCTCANTKYTSRIILIGKII